MHVTRNLTFRPAALLGEFDRLVRSSLGDRPANRDFTVHDSGDAWVLRTDLPGYRREDLKVVVEDDLLTLEAPANDEQSRPARNYRVRLPESVDRSRITARLELGVLELTLPRTEPKQPEARRIQIT